MSESFIVKKLGDVFKMTSGGTPSRRIPSFYNGSIPWVKSGELESNLILDTEEKISEDALRSSSAKIFPKGTLLIALYGATIGKLAKLGIEAATNQAVCGIFENQENDLQYLYWYLQFKRSDLIRAGAGGAQPNISQTILKNLEIPLPKRKVQQQIVSKIEELFSDLGKSIEDLKTSQQQLKVYRQSVLKWAFEGKLTNDYIKDGELPRGWITKSFGDATINYDGKRVPISKEVRAKRKGQYRYYGATEIVDYIDDYIFEGEFLLIGEDGANLLSKARPLAFIVDGKFWVNNHAHVIRTKEFLLLKFLNYYFNSINVSEFVSGSAQPKLNQANLNKIPIPLPPREEQYEIIEEIESRLSVADKLEETITSSLQQAEALRQSILKKAFGGKSC